VIGLLLPVAVCGILAFAQQPATQSTGGFVIAGKLVDAQTGAPIAFARITLDPQSQRTGPPHQLLKTGAEGTFTFRSLRPGMYSLTAHYRGLAQPYGLAGPARGFGVGVLVGPGVDTSNLTFRWFRSAAISGVVKDGDNEPVPNVSLQLIRVTVSRGKRTLVTTAWANSDERGRYRFGAVAASSYFVVATAAPQRDVIDRLYPPESNSGPQAYLPAYFPSPPSLDASAKPVSLQPGDEIRADLTLTRVPGVRLTVKHPAEAGRSRLMLFPEHLAELSTPQVNQWAYGGANSSSLDGVPPGRYMLRYVCVNPNSITFIERQISLVNAQESVELSIPTPASVSGEVTFPPGSLPKRAFSLDIREARNLHNFNVGAKVSNETQTGQLAQMMIPPGTYRASALSAEGYAVRDLKVSGAAYDPSTGQISITEGASVRLQAEVSNETGSLNGLVVDTQGNPAQGVLVVLLGAIRAYSYIGEFQTDSDGTFSFRNVPAGEYLLFATSDFGFRYAEPGVLRRLPGADGSGPRIVRLEAGKPQSVERLNISTVAELTNPPSIAQ
jgi:hypothetical protein